MVISTQKYNSGTKQVVLIIKLVATEFFLDIRQNQTFMVSKTNVNNFERVRMQLKFMPKDPRLIKVLLLLHQIYIKSSTLHQRKFQGEFKIEYANVND